MANGEAAIKTALASGDATKVAAAHAAYVASMEKAGQTPKPLSDFKK